MSPSTRPGILISHGGLHQAVHYDAVKHQLEAAGFDPVLAATHPTIGPNSRGKTLLNDVEALQAQMAPYVDTGKEFIVLAHSYGGFPGFEATKGWSVAERAAAGKKGGVCAVVFVAATVPLERGGAALGLFEEDKAVVYPPCFDHGPTGVKVEPPSSRVRPPKTQLTFFQGQLITPNAASRPSFYNDMSDDEAEKWEKLLLPQSQEPLEEPVDYVVADARFPLYYVLTLRDQTVPIGIQRSVAAAIPDCRTFTVDAGHSVYISQTSRLVELVETVADQISEEKARSDQGG
jgi:pimeloyl-ACP methyl ester carboxylesterase